MPPARYKPGDVLIGEVVNPATGGKKARPVLVIASWECEGDHDYLVCFITTKDTREAYYKPLPDDAIEGGSLDQKSFIRPTYLTAMPEYAVHKKVGRIKPAWLKYVRETLHNVIGPV